MIRKLQHLQKSFWAEKCNHWYGHADRSFGWSHEGTVSFHAKIWVSREWISTMDGGGEDMTRW